MSFEGLQERLTALQETTTQLKELIDRLATLKFQPGSVPLATDEENSVSGELSTEITGTLRDGEEEYEILHEEVEFVRAAEHDRARLREGVEKIGKELASCRLSFRKARLSAKQSLLQAQRLERELMVTSFSQPTSEAGSLHPDDEKPSAAIRPARQHHAVQQHQSSSLSGGGPGGGRGERQRDQRPAAHARHYPGGAGAQRVCASDTYRVFGRAEGAQRVVQLAGYDAGQLTESARDAGAVTKVRHLVPADGRLHAPHDVLLAFLPEDIIRAAVVARVAAPPSIVRGGNHGWWRGDARGLRRRQGGRGRGLGTEKEAEVLEEVDKILNVIEEANEQDNITEEGDADSARNTKKRMWEEPEVVDQERPRDEL
ncbi:hypothetical protein MRS44_000804 [Fusarium solani]|uniref:uncharacterized protein n=1 Tax=Fusarium solani TaxID=169388 RepID=UPI0032C49D62|nr:hypothetical protein MRS44_000804 [Fusarium solani]